MEKQTRKSAAEDSHATCIVSGTELPKKDMLRLVVSPDGVLLCDVKGKLPAEGIFIQADEDIMRLAFSQGLIQKHLSVVIPDDFDIAQFIQNIKNLLDNRIAEWLSMANKSGSLVAGFVKVEKALRNGEIILLIQAGDASDDGRKKLRNIANRDNIAIDESMTRDFLSNALAKSDAVHIGILHTQFSREILRESRRLAGFCKKDSL